MAKTESTMLILGTKLKHFELNDSNGHAFSSKNFEKPALIIFMCNHCPFVIHIQEQLISLGNYYKDQFEIIGINSNNAITYPEDGIEVMKEHQKKYPFPYLVDESQEVAKMFSAACTPDFFLFNTSQELVYRGQLDSSRPLNKIPSNGEDLRKALDSILNHQVIDTNQKPSIGCNIKWKEGNEPTYFSKS